MWVAASCEELGFDLENPHDTDLCMPYDGEHLYRIHVVITLLRENVITEDHCRWGLRATRGVDPKVVKAAATDWTLLSLKVMDAPLERTKLLPTLTL